jgi:hypothetical protein
MLKAAEHRRTPKRKREMAFGLSATFWSAALLCRFFIAAGNLFLRQAC